MRLFESCCSKMIFQHWSSGQKKTNESWHKTIMHEVGNPPLENLKIPTIHQPIQERRTWDEQRLQFSTQLVMLRPTHRLVLHQIVQTGPFCLFFFTGTTALAMGVVTDTTVIVDHHVSGQSSDSFHHSWPGLWLRKHIHTKSQDEKSKVGPS